MAQVKASDLQVNKAIEIDAPDSLLVILTTDTPLAVGAYTFQLEVEDDSKNRSQPIRRTLFVIDNEAPTAIFTAPERVPFNREFGLSGKGSVDVGGGTIARYIWTLVEGR